MSIHSIIHTTLVPGGGSGQRTIPDRTGSAPIAGSSQAELPSAQVDATTLKQVADAINTQLQQLSKNIRFSIDEETGNTVVRVVDADTGQTIRQIPSEEVLKIRHSLERLQGVLLQHEA
ncbi:MAG TPA: flagellar protein FlaG [Burkholderiales bacterium]|nr:flagellar protein FlaG [Burkholderiales bacterium]